MIPSTAIRFSCRALVYIPAAQKARTPRLGAGQLLQQRLDGAEPAIDAGVGRDDLVVDHDVEARRPIGEPLVVPGIALWRVPLLLVREEGAQDPYELGIPVRARLQPRRFLGNLPPSVGVEVS